MHLFFKALLFCLLLGLVLAILHKQAVIETRVDLLSRTFMQNARVMKALQ